MKKTLYFKFIIAYFLFAFFGFITVSTVSARLIEDYCVKARADFLYREASEISETYGTALYDSEISLDSVHQEFSSHSSYLGVQIWILNPSGRMVVDSSKVLDPNQETIVENFTPSVFKNSYYVTGDFLGSFSEEQLSVVAPITTDYTIRGYVIIHQPMAAIRRTSADLLNLSYLLLLMLLLLSMIILIFFTQIVYRPLQKIIHATEEYAAGNMHYELSIDSDDELGYLAGSLQYMSGQMARFEDDQKKFIANVSHDFRSPLTSMHGFLEAMLDGTIPPEKHDDYIRRVLDQTDRLTKLTNSLLQLNNMNTAGMLLSRTDFDINRTIYSVAQSFESTCSARNISFELKIYESALFVNADEEKIQQVLYNLVDNAIKFSNSNSVVRIETTEKRNKVFVSVKDNGIGIPNKEQRLIWDRFYKTDLSRGKDKKGTGLGLSIVREIIRAHDEHINLISTEGVGTEFIFTLKRSDLNDAIEE